MKYYMSIIRIGDHPDGRKLYQYAIQDETGVVLYHIKEYNGHSIERNIQYMLLMAYNFDIKTIEYLGKVYTTLEYI